jgi:hypothetical protein
MCYADITFFSNSVSTDGHACLLSWQCILCFYCRTGGVPPGMTALIAVMCSLGCLGIGAVLAVVIMRGTVDQQKQREKERQNVSRLWL